MLKNQVHPAAIRSKNLISNSLLTLMKDNPYERISVTDITEHALLTRRTFYAHFKSKEDVLEYQLNTLNSELLTITESADKTHRAMAYAYFHFWMDHVDYLKLMKQHKLLTLVFENFENQIKEMRSLFECKLAENDPIYADYSSAYFTGVLSNILSRWIEKGAQESPETLVEIIYTITNSLSSHFSDLDKLDSNS